MMKKILKEIRSKWHSDLVVQYNELRNQNNELKNQNNVLITQCNDLNYKIMALMKQILPGKPEDELSFLFDMYGSDKGSIHKKTVHTYTETYHTLFSPMRNEVKAVFECGIYRGASLRAWRDYFKYATIIGGDINENSLFEEPGIHTALLDQMDAKSIKQFFILLSPNYPVDFDIIVDDGCHIYEATLCLFENSINHLKPNGIYIIEDMLDEYFPEYEEYFKKYHEEKIKVEFKRMSHITGNPHNNLIVIHKVK
jgi:SAM-dependent methyltransferase